MRAPWWLGLIAFGCGGGTLPPQRDHARVFEVRAHDATYRDDPFDAEVVTQFRTADVLEDLDVRALAVSGTDVYAGTATGLFVLRGEKFERIADGEIVDLFSLGDGNVLAAGPGGITRHGSNAAEWPAPAGLRAIAPGRDAMTVLAGTDRALLEISQGHTATIAAFEVRDVSESFIAASTGAYRVADPATKIAGMDEARAIAGEWIAGGDTLMNMRDGKILTAEPGGVPTDDHRALATSEGELMIGHAIGASACATESCETFEHYHSLRWIPAEDVRAVAIGPGRTRWIATSAGITRITYEPTTLRAKAEALDATIETGHLRMNGFVADDVAYDSPYDHSAGPRYWDNDNDGLWTEMQLGTWCLAYAVTKDENYYRQARRSLEVMLMEIDIPALTFAARGKSPGRITRSLVRDDEGPSFETKKDSTEWHRQEYLGHTYYWKDTTSSDEYAGHYFGLPLYYDLCAKDEAEREEVRSRVKLATDYIIESGYRVLDIEGRETDFGYRDVAAAADGIDGCPDRHDLDDCFISFGGGGWLNSMEILGMLLATWHMTGDEHYYAEYERLYTDEKYGKMLRVSEDTLTVSSPRFANHSDHELATLAYFTLLRYEPNEDRRAIVVQSFLDFYEYERPEHNPWQVGTIALAHGPDVDLDGAIKSLRDIPLDRRNWNIDNKHRKDARPAPPDRGGSPQFDRAFPYDEINCLKWNGDPYNVADGALGYDVISPTPYLISYWMMRYSGLITE